MRVRLKVCCISSLAEARLAVAAGADALGLVSRMPSGPGVIAADLIAEIAAAAPPAVGTFLLTAETDGAAIADQVRCCGTNTVQLVDLVAPGDYARLRAGAPQVKVVQVIHVQDESAVELAQARASHVDALLLDSGRPQAPVAELGGTGRRHDWSISRKIVDSVDRPVFLAGGLSPDNVLDAVAAVRPFGVDLCTGVRRDGRLDPGKLHAFAQKLGRAAA